ncbi:ABC transporter ATP-binding protein [Lysinibacter cavernae]|uniref:Multidrug/hemolysin transport system ATP-binding protein n=1 Tax=Lysinibacter cavernae TaxID=1640652 RepID=A0A7X5TTM8_9MICO|nr:ABC transporter ATP-binding protein [Lysinibacter cavernae]NIH54370.1 multidrug/hemolysin transport system ATP-binding protein [Lysinibacter cavernae]
MTTSPAISVRNLTKTYRDVTAVNDVSFDVLPGTVFAFLGTNGAGKSTTISCITTLLEFDSGQIEVLGQRVGKGSRDAGNATIRRQIGVVFQNSVLDPLLTVIENLRVRASFYGIPAGEAKARIAELTTLIGLEEVLDRPYGKLSGGQKRRADIARALIHNPSILFLDEPTTGLDPQSREQVWEAIDTLRATQGITVFLTTHYMEETEKSDEVCIIKSGTIAVRGTAAALRSRYSSSILTVTPESIASTVEWCSAHNIEYRVSGDALQLPVESSAAALGLLNKLGDTVRDFEFRHGTMDDVFLAVTGADASTLGEDASSVPGTHNQNLAEESAA